MIDRHPAVNIRCETPEDVLAGIDFAQAQELPITVNGRVHGVAGRAVCDGRVMLDLSPMGFVEVNPVQRTAVVGPGVTRADLDRETE